MDHKEPCATMRNVKLSLTSFSLVQFSPVTDWGIRDMTGDSAEILFGSFLQKAIVSSSGKGRDGHSLTLSIQHFLC